MMARIHRLSFRQRGILPAGWRRVKRRGVLMMKVCGFTTVLVSGFACGDGPVSPSAQLQGAYEFAGCEGVEFIPGISCRDYGSSASYTAVYAGRITFTLPDSVRWIVNYRDNNFGTITERAEDLAGTFAPPESGFVTVTFTTSGRVETLKWSGQNRLTWQWGIMKPLFNKK